MSGKVVAAVIIFAFAVAGLLIIANRTSAPGSSPVSPLPQASPLAVSPAPSPAGSTRTIQAQTIAGAAPAFTFTGSIPAAWQAEAVPASASLNLYDPAAPAATPLDQSQIFIRSFTANDFQTLSTVTIHARATRTLNGRPAVRYDIAKPAGASPFPDQPAWRNQRHIVTDVRVTDTNPSVFYVIAQRPDLDPAVYENFLNSLRVNAASAAVLQPPVAHLTTRITKKPFGLYVEPGNSPVENDRFTGWHTGIDIEYADVPADVPVVAAAAGEVIAAQRASGYGGVVAIRHEINGQPAVGIYGHLKVDSLLRAGQTVTAGQRIGVLGADSSPDTDGERKHLHFALKKGSTLDLSGYVPNQSDLDGWYNPLEFYQ